MMGRSSGCGLPPWSCSGADNNGLGQVSIRSYTYLIPCIEVTTKGGNHTLQTRAL